MQGRDILLSRVSPPIADWTLLMLASGLMSLIALGFWAVRTSPHCEDARTAFLAAKATRDPVRATALYKDACGLAAEEGPLGYIGALTLRVLDDGYGVRACNSFAAALEKGIGTARDRERARALYRRAGELGSSMALTNRATMEWEDHNTREAFELNRQAAGQGEAIGYYNIHCALQEGRSDQKDLVQAQVMAKEACWRRHQPACLPAIQQEQDPKEAVVLGLWGCYTLKDGSSCNQLGAIYWEAQELVKARHAFRRACDLNVSMGCRNLKWMS